MGNKSIIVIILTSIIHCYDVFGQGKNKLNLEAGWVLSSFQDTKFSNIQYAGGGYFLGGNYSKLLSKSFLKFGALFFSSREYPNKHFSTSAATLNAEINAAYLIHIKKTFYLGLKWVFVDLYSKSFEQLSNNKYYFNISSKLKLNGKFKLFKRLDANIELGVLSYVIENNGFSFSYFQNALEQGEYQNQNLGINTFDNLKYGEFFHLFSGFNMGIILSWQLSNNFDIKYKWQVERFSIIDNFPVTSGYNIFSISYNIIKR